MRVRSTPCTGARAAGLPRCLLAARACRLAVVLAGLTGLAVMLDGCGRHRTPPPPVRDVARCPGRDPAIGFHLISWKDLGASGAAAWRGAVEDLASHGVARISLAVVRLVDPSTGELAIEEAALLPRLEHLEAGLRRARELGLQTTVIPFVEPEGFGGWRGELDLNGSVAARFFAAYRDLLADVAALSEAHGVSRLLVGTELRGLVGNPEHRVAWTDIVDEVGTLFSGQLGYAASWDDYRDPVLTEVLWEHPRLDFLGIDAYFPVASAVEAEGPGAFPDRAFVAGVANRWRQILDQEVLPFAAARRGGTGLPVLFTEVGLVPFDGATASPSSQVPGPGLVVDVEEQLAGYAGLLAAVSGRGAALPEVTVWHWGMPGAEGSHWFQHPDAVDVPGTPFDESLGARSAAYLTGYARGELTVLGSAATAGGCAPDSPPPR